jgi:hypothetical protein
MFVVLVYSATALLSAWQNLHNNQQVIALSYYQQKANPIYKLINAGRTVGANLDVDPS